MSNQLAGKSYYSITTKAGVPTATVKKKRVKKNDKDLLI
jgi:Tfp pilus assembly major pilin PilA